MKITQIIHEMKFRTTLFFLSIFFAFAAKAQNGNADIKSDTSKYKFMAVSDIGLA